MKFLCALFFLFQISFLFAQSTYLHPVPGKIEAEHFNEGENGVAYFDRTADNLGLAKLRPGTGVDLQTHQVGNARISHFQMGEWLTYSLSSLSGLYDLQIICSNGTNKAAHLEVLLDDQSQGIVPVAATESITTMGTAWLRDLSLSEGRHQLKLLAKDRANVSIDCFTFIKKGKKSSLHADFSHSIPGTIQAEDFLYGENGVAYFDTTPGNSGYYTLRDSTDVDLQTIDNRNARISHVRPGEWWKYAVRVEPGNYHITIRAGGLGRETGSFALEIGGVLIATVDVSHSGSWDHFEEFTVRDVAISSSELQTLKVTATTGRNINLDSLQFVKAD